MDTTNREAEIREIERELHILQRRYASLDRSGRRMRATVYCAMAVLGVLVLISAVLGHLPAMLLFGGVFAWALFAVWTSRRAHPERWMDSALYAGLAYGIRQTEREAVEDMVAERVERLARLKGS